MHLSKSQKDKLLQSANQVYFSYLALDFFKSKTLPLQRINPMDTTSPSVEDETLLGFSKLCLIGMRPKQEEMEDIIHVDGHSYTLNISRREGTQNRYALTLHAHQDTIDVTKVPNDYTDAEIGHILAEKSFYLEVLPNREVAVSVALSHEHVIGGAQKIDLYRTHLVTLSNIINKISKEDDISSLLVALATGSGKTYVQALLFATLSLSEFNAVFALPDKLIAQLKKDWQRILPDALIDRIVTLRDRDAEGDITQAVHNLQTSQGNSIIASSKLLLDKHYDSLLAVSPEHTCLIFDEQHLLMANERRRLRLLILNQQFLSVFLTATPNEETYKISGAKPVAIMSSGQKQKAGQGQFPVTQPIQCEFVADLHRKKVVRFGSREYVQKQAEGFILRFDDAIQKECSSAIRAVFDELPYVVKRKENETDVRWRLQVPMASKVLCIIDDNESLVNCCHTLQTNDHNVYHNGNFVGRSSTSTFFGIPNVDQSTLDTHKYNKRSQYVAQLLDDEHDILREMPGKTVKEQLKSNMFHYLVEYVLSDLSGKSMIEHNRARKASAEGFRDSIVSQYQSRNESYYYQKLIKEIDEEGARTISPLLEVISNSLGTFITRSSPRLTAFTNNWFLEDTMSYMTYPHNFQYQFDAYARRYLVMGLMSGMEEAETPIKDSKPFLGLIEDCYPLTDHASGIQSSRAKRRQRTSIELLDDQALESSFTPNYLNITEEIADAYFRLGFVGMYVSNKKTEGFNDPNLHTIINAAEHAHDANNSPVSLIQSIGRGRGLDDTMVPHYFHGLGHNQASSFDLQALAKDDYYPELFVAQKRFEEKYIAALGEQVGKDIISWYHQHQAGDDSIDADQLKKKVLYLVADALRRLNIQSTHRILLSRAALPRVIAHAMAKLDKEIDHTKRPYRLSLFVRVVGSIINFICECYFTILKFKPWIAMFWHAWTLARGPQNGEVQDAAALRAAQADAIYMKILRQAHFKDLTAQGLIAGEFKAWLERKSNVTKTLVEKSALFYLKPEIKTQVEEHLRTTVYPIFEKMVRPEKAARVREKLQQFHGLLFFLQTHAETIQSLQNDRSDEEFSAVMLPLFHKIPGLEGLKESDIVNYPRRVAEHQAWVAQPLFTLTANTPELKERAITALTEFLTDDLQNYISAFVTYPDKQRMMRGLQQDPERVRAFATQYIDGAIAHPDVVQDFDQIFADFQTFFGFTDIKLLLEKSTQIRTDLEAYQLITIADMMRRKLLPCMVNLYPHQARARLLAEVTQDKFESLLHTHKSVIQDLIAQNDPQKLAAFFFNSLCTNVPQQIDLEQEKLRAQTFFAAQMQVFSAVNNGIRYAVDYVSRKTTGSDVGLMSGRIQTLLLSEECAQSLSSLLPFHHWQVLQQRFKAEPNNLKKLAAKLVPYIDHSSDLSAEILLQEINGAFGSQLQMTQVYAAQVGEEIRPLVNAEKVVCTTPAQTARLATIVRASCLPLLATYLATDTQKEQFLAQAYDDQTLCTFFIEHFAEFNALGKMDVESQKQAALSFIQELYPDFANRQDIVDPKLVAEEQSKKCKSKLTSKIKVAFMMSGVCKEKLVDLFNAEDAQVLQANLSIKDQAELIAASFESDSMDLDPVRAAVPDLKDIEFLHIRLENLKTDLEETLKLGLAAFDNDKLADTFTAQIQPIFDHAQFRKLLNLYMGSLKEQELQVIFEACGKENAPEMAKRLFHFKTVINRRDFVGFKQAFVQYPGDAAYDFERSPLKLVLEDFESLAGEVVNCHCYYQQHDSKGLQTSEIKPGLYTLMSDTLKDIRIPADPSFISHFSRKIFFIQGVRNGLPLAGQVYADSHSNTIKNLQLINSNLLRPLWWSVNTFQFVYGILEGAKTLFFYLKDWLYKLLDKIKTGLRQAFALATPQVTPRQGINVDFTESAFATAKVINALQPLTRDQVAERHCPKDVITHVEQEISQLPGHRLRLFQTRLARGEEDWEENMLHRNYL